MMKTSLIAFLALALPLAAEQEDLTRLRTDWQDARTRALDPIDRKYITALEALKTRLTKAGKLDEAVQVEAELKKVLSGPGGGFKGHVTPEILVTGEWRFDMKEPKYTNHFTFTPSGEIFERGKKEVDGRWKIKGSRLRLEFKDTWAEFDLSYEGAVVLTEKDSNSGKRSGVTLTQVIGG
jgi:hypothetical protein